jgi:pimeloyl-ACP methyl ester carboxylesterase
MRATNLLIAVLVLFSPLLRAAAPAGQTCHLPGQREALRCTTIAVPRDYADAAKGTLDLHVAIAPAVRANAEADPLFVLAGGPGQAGSDITVLLDTAFAKVRANRDVVFIDQRGTGRSERLDCNDGSDPLTLDDAALRAATLACLRGFGDRLLSYTTQAAADDLDRVRDALGAERINVWGGSYGTRLAQVYAQRHPERVRSLILDGVADADLIIGADSGAFDATYEALLQRCADDAACARAFPSARQDLDDVLRTLDAAAATPTLPHPRSGQAVTVPISRERVLRTLQYLLYSPRNAAQLPYVIARARAGDWRPLLAIQVSSTDLAAAQPAIGLLMAIACREDWPRRNIEPSAPPHAAPVRPRIFGRLNLSELDAVCGALALPVASPAPPSTLDMPSLLLSGALDPATPPSRAENALRHLPHAQHAIAANAGHIVSGSGCAPKLLRRFLDAPSQPVDAACLAEIALPAFQTSAAGAAP